MPLNGPIIMLVQPLMGSFLSRLATPESSGNHKDQDAKAVYQGLLRGTSTDKNARCVNLHTKFQALNLQSMCHGLWTEVAAVWMGGRQHNNLEKLIKAKRRPSAAALSNEPERAAFVMVEGLRSLRKSS